MAKQPFLIQDIDKLDDGRVAAAINMELDKLTRDCLSRPGDTAARTLTLTMTLKPQSGERGVCETAAVEFGIQAKLPPRRSKTFEMATHAKGTLIFNPASEGDIRQGTLDEAGD